MAAFIDVYDPDGGILPKVIDHKSAKNRRYAKKADDILVSTQMLTYGCYPLVQYPSCDQVEGVYNVLLKDMSAKKGTFSVRNTMSKQLIVDRWTKNLHTVRTMQDIRNQLPVGDKKDPLRGSSYRQIEGAVDTRNDQIIKRVCGAFGGCPYKDACHGMCSIEQLTRRYDGQSAHPKQQQVSMLDKPLAASNTTSPTINPTKGLPMLPFNSPTPTPPPSIQAGSDAYVKDPESNQQYRVRVNSTEPCVVFIWPDPGQEPDFASLGEVYKIGCLTLQDLSPTMLPNIPLARYDQALAFAGVAEETYRWQPASTTQVPEATPPPPFASLKPTETSAAPASAAPTSANEDRTLSPPADPWVPPIGTQVKVIPSDHNYWSKLAGKYGRVVDVSADNTLTVDIDGNIYPDVATGRFAPVEIPPQPVQQQMQLGTQIPESTATPTPAASLPPAAASAQMLIGRQVHIQHAKIDSSFRGICNSVDAEGVHLEGYGKPVAWDLVGSIQPAEDVPIPGDAKDAARVEKKQHMDSLTIESSLDEINRIIEAGEAKKQPGIGKKDLAKIREYLDKARQLLASGAPAAPTLAATPASPAAPDAGTGTYEQGWAAACSYISNQASTLSQNPYRF
ncbi:MAG: hypothetical protein GF414_00590 [Candidatus Altiarchaeales archaeon]|nr:hypothetical protein [Candidatus Altiarchaeales archaeon]